MKRLAKVNRVSRFESMEERRVMMAASFFNPGWDTGGGIVYDGPIILEQAVSTASLNLNGATGELQITGLDPYHDNVKVTIDNMGTVATTDDMVRVAVNNIGDTLIQKFSLAQVKSVLFNALGGDDRFENLTALPSKVYGGLGNDILLGGSGRDEFFGGDGIDFLDGRLGNDLLHGEGGNDWLFGDAGNDELHGGLGLDRVYGGTGNDKVFGENDADWLDGGAGVNTLYGGGGSDRFFGVSSKSETRAADLNKKGDSTRAGYDPVYGWFDTNLSDSALRSLARLNYYSDVTIDRTEMIGLYSQVQVNGVVSAAELADLRKISAPLTGLKMREDIRVLSGKVVGSDAANARYQGQSLGNLAANDSSAKMDKLIRKWFYGSDAPLAGSGTIYKWASGSLFQNGPSLSDIEQRDVNDCYLLATLGEVAQQSPAAIQNMFVDNGDGTFAVRYYNGGVADYVTVDRNLPVVADTSSSKYGTAKYAGFGGAFMMGSNELWVALAEKAYVQMNESGWLGQDGINQYSAINLGSPQLALAQITGKAVDNFKSFNGITANYLGNMFNTGVSITFTSNKVPSASNVVKDHVYAMAGYDASTGRIQLFNPWGTGSHNTSSSQPGLIWVTWEQLVGNFRRFKK